jgi:hypothetical protein
MDVPLSKAFRDKYNVLSSQYHPDEKVLQISLGLYTEFMLTELDQIIVESGEPVEWLCFFTPFSHMPKWHKR